MNNAQQSLRTFFALWPDDPVRDELARRATWAAKACGGRPAQPSLLHLTLVFVGATPRQQLPGLHSLMDAIDVPAFVLDLDRCGWFRHNGVVWAGEREPPEALLDLQHALARGAERQGFSLDVRPYSPHLTLARDAGRSPPAAPMPPLRWGVKSFVLVSSRLTPAGPRYEIIREHALAAPPAVDLDTDTAAAADVAFSHGREPAQPVSMQPNHPKEF